MAWGIVGHRRPRLARPRVGRADGLAFALLLSVAAVWIAPPVVSSAPFTSALRLTRVAAAASPIKHVVVLYQENHAFDELLGNWCATTGRCNGIDVTKPVTLKGGAQVLMHRSPDLVPNVNHSVASQLAAMDGGLMDGWASVPGCTATPYIPGAIPYGCLTYYAPAQIPNLVALSTKFAVSDRTFSMADSPTWGGHVYAVAATIDHFTGDNPVQPNPKPRGWTKGPGWGCNSNLVTSWVNPSTGVSSQQPSCIPDPALSLPNGGAFEPTMAGYVPTIMDELDAASLPWRIYAPSQNALRSICPSFAECEYGPSKQLQKVVPSGQVLTNAASGALPAFSVVIPTDTSSQHNGYSMAAGDNWIGQVVSAIENGPAWSSTAIFITYDDCGCFYDHVAAGQNPDGTRQGIRVPMVIVSPYAISGHTDSAVASFASILRFAEKTFGLSPLDVNDAGAYDFAGSFNYAQVPLSGTPMVKQPVRSIGGPFQDPNDPT
jgi:phospholipase C